MRRCSAPTSSLQKARTAAFFSSIDAAAVLTSLPPANYPTAPPSPIASYVTATRIFLDDPTALAERHRLRQPRRSAISRGRFSRTASPAPRRARCRAARAELEPLQRRAAARSRRQQARARRLPPTRPSGARAAPPASRALANGIQIFPGSVPIYPRQPAGRRDRRFGRRHRPGRHGRVPRARQRGHVARQTGIANAPAAHARRHDRAAGRGHAAALRELPAGAVQRQHRSECLRRLLTAATSAVAAMARSRRRPLAIACVAQAPAVQRARPSRGAGAAPERGSRYVIQVLRGEGDGARRCDAALRGRSRNCSRARASKADERRGTWYRVSLSDGRTGWINHVAGKVEPELRRRHARPGVALARPDAAAPRPRAAKRPRPLPPPGPCPTIASCSSARWASRSSRHSDHRSEAGAAAVAAAAARDGADPGSLAPDRPAQPRQHALVRPVQPEHDQGRPPGVRQEDSFFNFSAISDTLFEWRAGCPRRSARNRRSARSPTTSSASGKQSQFVENLILCLLADQGRHDVQAAGVRVPLRAGDQLQLHEDRGSARRSTSTRAPARRATTTSSACRSCSSTTSTASCRTATTSTTCASASSRSSSDFRGFLFQDQPVGIRFFGTRDNNHWQYNLGWFRRLEKDTNSGLNDIAKPLRDDDIFFANLYRQDFMVPGFTLQGTVIYNRNHETANEFFDNNGFQVRPAVLGDVRPHELRRVATSASTATATSAVEPHRVAVLRARPRRATTSSRSSRPTSAPSSPPPRCRATSTGSACAARRCSQSGDNESVRRQGERLRRDPREPAVRRRRHELLDPPGDPADRRRRRRAVRPQRRAAVAALVEGPGPVELRQSRASRWSASAPTST